MQEVVGEEGGPHFTCLAGPLLLENTEERKGWGGWGGKEERQLSVLAQALGPQLLSLPFKLWRPHKLPL